MVWKHLWLTAILSVSLVRSSTVQFSGTNNGVGIHAKLPGVCVVQKANSRMISTDITLYATKMKSTTSTCGLFWKKCTTYSSFVVPVIQQVTHLVTDYHFDETCCIGYSGSTPDCKPICEIMCENGGTCTAPGVCSCPSGWSGAYCETASCTTPCENGGRCSAPDTCSCLPLWTSSKCETAICVRECENGGECVAPGECLCSAGWTGAGCEQAVCTQPCHNGGHCSAPDVCSCVPSWTGPQCDTAICEPECENGGVCRTPGECSCPTGWDGTYCQEGICTPPCQNGGRCSSPDVCSCPPLWTGLQCETAICEPKCENGGVCRAPGECSCPREWDGTYCQEGICTVPCQNGGRCSSPDVCSCSPLWTGLQCETAICVPECENGGECVAPGGCLCSARWTGAGCEQSICTQPCQNEGHCSAFDVCSCLPSWTGPQCETAICEPRCQNDGACVAPGECSCLSEWVGTHCQQALVRLSITDASAERITATALKIYLPAVHNYMVAVQVNFGTSCDTQIAEDKVLAVIDDVVGSELIIDDISPRDTVCVLIANRTGGEIEHFSQSIHIPLYVNTPIQLQLQSSSHGDCEKMQQNLILAIETQIAAGISEVGRFSFPTEYVANGQLLCTDAPEGKLTFQATLVSTDYISSTNLASLLYYWSKETSEPVVIVAGQQRFIVQSVECITYKIGPQTVQCNDLSVPTSHAPTTFPSYTGKTAGSIVGIVIGGIVAIILAICGICGVKRKVCRNNTAMCDCSICSECDCCNSR